VWTVKAWLAEYAVTVEMFYLRSYGPELNPDEMANADNKQVGPRHARRCNSLRRPRAT